MKKGNIKMSFEAFKKQFMDFEKNATSSKDVETFDLDNGFMLISKNKLGKYLEKYMCKNEEDLQDTLWYNYGVFCKIIE